MTHDQNKKTLRHFQCRDYLWDIFEQMSRELECSTDYLINEAMRQYARSRNYGQRSPSVPGMPRPQSQPQVPGQPPQAQPQPSGFAQPSPAPAASSIPSMPRPQSAPAQQFGGAAPGYGQQQGQPQPSGYGQPSHPGYPPSPGYGQPQAPQPPAQQQGYQQGYPPPSTAAPSYSPTNRPPAPSYQPPASQMPPPLPGGSRQPSYNGQQPTLFVIFNGQKIPITKTEFVIGRGSKTADLPIKDGNISRRHAAVVFENGNYFVKDLGSTNGIEFGGQRIDNKAINEGDVFQLCDYELRFTYR